MSERRLRVLMFAEAVTLAHVARPLALARALEGTRFDVVVACDPRYAELTAAARHPVEALSSIPGAQFTEALAKGNPVYNLATLEAYVAEDLQLIRRIEPDLVVGDFRLSLSVSARVAAIPYAAIANAYWSPQYARAFPLPVLPFTRVLPLGLASAVFSLFGPLAMSLHCRPMNALRRRHGLLPLGGDLRRVYTDADHLLVPDVEQLFPLGAGPHPHSHVGPLAWSPRLPLPAWWGEPVPDQQPTIYVTLGSSGAVKDLELVLRALADQPVRVIASSAGAGLSMRLPDNARVAPYLPGEAAAARARLVICNGGSLTTQQALAAGVPVLGIASNMDQFYNMGPLQEIGAGLTLRSDRLNVARVREACMQLLGSASAARAARSLQPLLQPSDRAATAFERMACSLVAR